MPQNAIIDLRGSKVNVRRYGNGEPLLYLHGAQGLGDSEPGLDALAQHFEVIAPDHPGFGRSDVSPSVEDIKDLSVFYFDVLDALKLDKVHIVGHCIGGWIALEMAVYTSERFKSLTLVNSAGVRLAGVPRGDMFLCSEGDLHGLLFAGAGAEPWAQAWHGSSASEDIYERNRAAAARFTWSPRLCNPKLDRWLHRVSAPTHIIWSKDNKVLPLAYAQALKDMIPGASVATLDNCAHMLPSEQPQKFAGEVAQFIRRAAP